MDRRFPSITPTDMDKTSSLKPEAVNKTKTKTKTLAHARMKKETAAFSRFPTINILPTPHHRSRGFFYDQTSS
jgi:hypothetical protein